ncbi:MarR family winged helix-turn-helix transcriptional regulator [Streptomyces sp. NPDC001594]|uniref:MarR family winged helix-turn-helix transcriptional regulator n=1 Tax=Streptomyces sp. NPDC001594 TaxID=3364590 RepID=UPI00367B399D
MPRPGRSGAHEDPAAVLAAAADFLAVLHARGQDGVTPPVSPSQLRALLAVEGAEGINLRALGEVLGSRPPSVTRLCDRLEAMGLLTRSPHPVRRREVELRLTPRARTLLDERQAIRLRELSSVLGRMAPGAVDALMAGLTAFHEAAAPPPRPDDPPPPPPPGPASDEAPTPATDTGVGPVAAPARLPDGA